MALKRVLIHTSDASSHGTVPTSPRRFNQLLTIRGYVPSPVRPESRNRILGPVGTTARFIIARHLPQSNTLPQRPADCPRQAGPKGVRHDKHDDDHDGPPRPRQEPA